MGFDRPKWQEDLSAYHNIKTTFILSGNIHDLQLDFDCESGRSFATTMDSYLYNYLRNEIGYARIIFYNRVDGFYNNANSRMQKEFKKYCVRCLGEAGGSDGQGQDEGVDGDYSFKAASEIIREALSDADVPTAIVFDSVTSAITSPARLTDEEQDAFSRLLVASQRPMSCIDPASGKQLTNTLLLIVDKINDVPSWFYVNNPYVKTLTVGKPSRFQRKAYIETQMEKMPGTFSDYSQLDDDGVEKLMGELCNLTEGFCCMELKGFLQKCADDPRPASEARRAISTFRYGQADNMWERVDRDAISNAEAIMRNRVKGQDRAIEKAVSILFRAASGMSLTGSRSNSTKPKGVLFLAGPTGTGKTELAKSIAEGLFSDETQMIRFDMSEFSKSQSDQRLFGAPPGYVGYEAGGELTNAVKEKPFSVLLFDEIEKADSSIFDKFLQVLDDGRLTDSHGETVYFGETIIIFTSNYGLSDRDPFTNKGVNVITAQTYDTYEKLKNAVEDNIRNPEKSIFRPEFINRIGENFVVFDFIDEGVAEEILRGKLASLARRVRDENGIDLYMTWDYYRALMGFVKSNLGMGGRGVVNMLEARFLNPLSKTVFCGDFPLGSKLLVTREYTGSDHRLEGTFDYECCIPRSSEGFELMDESARPVVAGSADHGPSGLEGDGPDV